MEDVEFEKIVEQGIASIPKEFLDKLDNVAITIEDMPTYFQMQKIDLAHGFLLFGLYEGIPRNKRGNYTSVLPDKITIFKNPILRSARDRKDLIEIVKNTVWHEIAHHFGMNEQEVRRAEAERIRKSPSS